MTAASEPSPVAPDRRPIGWTSTLGLVALLGVVAFIALPRTVQPGDAGEFATVMLRGGVPHPSGYPWMRLLGLPARGSWSLGLPPVSEREMRSRDSAAIFRASRSIAMLLCGHTSTATSHSDCSVSSAASSASVTMLRTRSSGYPESMGT